MALPWTSNISFLRISVPSRTGSSWAIAANGLVVCECELDNKGLGQDLHWWSHGGLEYLWQSGMFWQSVMLWEGVLQYAWLTICGHLHENCQSISHGQGYYDVVPKYAWLTIHGCLGIVCDCQNISDSRDTLARCSTICMAEKPWQRNSSRWTFYIDRLKWLVYSTYFYHIYVCITYVYCGALTLVNPG